MVIDGGSLARTGLPGTVSLTSYDAANELTNWNGVAISYDADGNMLSDGDHIFVWDERNHASSINGIGLGYDAFGRRTTNSIGTSFSFDGFNAVQQVSGGTVTANLLTGNLDEVFSEVGSNGTSVPLQDELGSVIALVNNTGTITTAYTFDPFGVTSLSGTGSLNLFQYAGRENELNGLYYYRARYYNPLIGRFISEDPLGFAGSGQNLYAYASDSPINFRDPMGLVAESAVATTSSTAEVTAKIGRAHV